MLYKLQTLQHTTTHYNDNYVNSITLTRATSKSHDSSGTLYLSAGTVYHSTNTGTVQCADYSVQSTVYRVLRTSSIHTGHCKLSANYIQFTTNRILLILDMNIVNHYQEGLSLF